MTTSTCRCGAAIIWVVTPAGKNMPLDAQAETRWVIDPEGAQQGSPRGRPIQVRMPHWASCPKADEFRKERAS